MAGDAHHGLAADGPARFGATRILLSHVHAVAAEARGEVGTIVEDERHAAYLGQRRQRLDGAGDHLVVRVLQPDLERGHVTRIQRRLQPGGEPVQVRQARRCDEVEAAGRRVHDPAWPP